MKINRIIICLLLMGLSNIQAQIENKLFSEAENLYNCNKFGSALSLYMELLKKDPYNADLNYKAGSCYMNSRSQKHKAITYLEKAISLSSSMAFKGFSKE